ncbi:Uncharacterised protein [uncultured archaeon]|nr:Uncharacterised protein [uncultured archaeon]
MLAVCDLSAWFPSIGAAYHNFVSSWSDIFLGRVMPITPGEFLLQVSLIALAGGNAAIAQGLFYLSLLPLSAVTMYLFLRYLIGSSLACVLVSILYAVNGLTIAWFMGGGQAMLPWHVFFPLLMLYLIKILEEDEGRILNMLIFALLWGLVSSFHVHMNMLWNFLPFVAVFFIIEIAYRRSCKYGIDTALLFMGAVGITLLLSAPIVVGHILDLIGYFAAPKAASASIFTGGYPVDYLVQSVTDNYSSQPVINMRNSFSYVIGFFAFFILLIRSNSSDRRLRYYLSFLLIGALSLVFTGLLSRQFTSETFLNLFRDIPFFLTLRSPSRLAFLLSWTIFPMMAILIAEVQERVSLRAKPPSLRWKQTMVFLLFCGAVIPLSFFCVTAELELVGSSGSWDNAAFFFNGYNAFSSYDLGDIPASFDRASEWLEEHREAEGFFRTAWLPSERLAGAKVLIRYDPLTFAFPSGEDYTTFCLMPLLQGNTVDAGKLLAPFDVKYIVVSLERWEGKYLERWYQGTPRLALQSPVGWWPTGDPQRYADLLNKQRDLKLVASDPGFLIYENLDFVPRSHISVYNKLFFVAPMSSITEPYECNDLMRLDRRITPTFDSAKYAMDSREGPSNQSIAMMPGPAQNPEFLYGHNGVSFPRGHLEGWTAYEEEFPYQYLRGMMQIRVPELLSKTPYLNDSHSLLVYGDFMSSDEDTNQYLNRSDAVIFLGGSVSSEKLTDKPKALLFVYEAEASLIPSHGRQRIVQASTLCYDHGIEVQGDWEGGMDFFAPRTSDFRVLLQANRGNITIDIDGQPVAIVRSYAGQHGFAMYEADAIHLKKGNHRLSLRFKGDRATLDQILLLSTKQKNATFEDIFASSQPVYNFTEINPSQYNLEVRSNDPCLIILKDSFHPEWQAYDEDGKSLMHMSALSWGWANGFYLTEGKDKNITIIFGREKPREIAIAIWEITLGSLIVAIGCLSLWQRRKSRIRH